MKDIVGAFSLLTAWAVPSFSGPGNGHPGKMAITRKLSELEGCVLGMVWANQPCTAYFIRRVFLDSPSPYWSGSAGAIYPLVERLERHGLIRSEERMTGRRRSRHYVLTNAGRKGLNGWLKLLPDLVVGVPPDPLRTRVEFLAALPKRQRDVFLADAKKKVEAHLSEVEKHAERERMSGNRYAYLAARGTLKVLRARLDWLGEISHVLGE
jgi:DNA-binding PadR family transcriptional regulator